MTNYELLFKHLNSELTPVESKSFERWLESDPENLKKLEDLKVIWERTKNYPQGFNPDVFKALEKVRSTADIEPARSFLRIGYISKIAVVAAIIIGLLGLLRYSYLNSTGKELLVTTGPTEVKEIVLPDSTHVWLNINSQLKYPERFAHRERKVSLMGEGYFEVRHNVRAPFSVDLEKSTVKVLGTHFDIQSYRNHQHTLVTVTEGRVKYSAKGNTRQTVILNVNDRGILDNLSLIMNKERVANKNFIAWKTHVLDFRNTPLLEVIKTLSAQYNTGYKVSNKRLGEIPINALFNNKSLNEIVNSLSVVTNGNIELRNDTIILK